MRESKRNYYIISPRVIIKAIIIKRDLKFVLRDLYTNKTLQTKMGGFKEAWRMSIKPVYHPS